MRIESCCALTDEQVILTRTARLTDTHWARLWKVTTTTVRFARIGHTYRHIPIPVDRSPRQGGGKLHRLNPKAVPARIRREWGCL